MSSERFHRVGNCVFKERTGNVREVLEKIRESMREKCCQGDFILYHRIAISFIHPPSGYQQFLE
jgi:hypothetical protein